MKPIEFDVNLGINDLYAFSMRHMYTNISGIFGLIISFGALILCGIRFSALDTTAKMALIVIGLLFTVVQPIMLYGKAKAQIRQNKNINAPLHYILDEEGISVSQGEQAVRVKWYEIRKKVNAKRCIYLYMSPVRAFIFPAGQCGEKYSEIIKIIDQKMKEYKDYVPEDELVQSQSEDTEKSEEE